MTFYEKLVKSFYTVNYVNDNYSVKYSTFECKYLLFLKDFFLHVKNKTVITNANKASKTHKKPSDN